jgi:hypothetical protein
MKEIAELHFLDEIIVVIDTLAIQTKTNPDPCVQHAENRRNACPQPQVGGRLVSYACSGFGKELDVAFCSPNAVSQHNFRPKEADVMHEADMRSVQGSEAVDFLKHGFQ